MTYDIKIHDVTLRDGEQSTAVHNPTVKSKLKITTLLDDFGVHTIEGGGFPKANKVNKKYFEKVGELNTNADIAIFLRTSESDVYDAIEAMQNLSPEKKVFTFVGKSSLQQVVDKERGLKKDPAAYLDEIRKCVELASKYGKVSYDAEFGLEALTPWASGKDKSSNAKKEYDYGLETLYAALDGGANVVYLCGTTGAGTHKDAAKAIKRVAETIEIDKLGIHPHDDRDLATAIALDAADEGVEWFQTTVNGVGERVGNLDLVTFLSNLYEDGLIDWPNIEKSTDLAREFSKTSHARISNNHPYTGADAFAHKGGMHSAAFEYYTRIDPHMFGNKITFPFTEQAGSGLVLNQAKEWDVELDTKKDPLVEKMVRNVHRMGVGGNAQFVKLLWNELGGTEPFTAEVIVPTIVMRPKEGTATSNVYTALLIDGDRYETNTSSEKGSMDAINKAYKEMLTKKFPNELKKFRLTDYFADEYGNGGTAANVKVAAEYNIKGKKDPITSVTVHRVEDMANMMNLHDAYFCAVVGKKLGKQYKTYLESLS